MRQALFDNPITGKPSISIGCQRSLLPLGEKKHNALRCICWHCIVIHALFQAPEAQTEPEPSSSTPTQHNRPAAAAAAAKAAKKLFRRANLGRRKIQADKTQQTQNAFLCPAIDPTKLDTFSVPLVSIDCSQRCSSFPPPHPPPCQTPPPSWPARSLPSSNRPLSVVPSTLLPPTWLSRPTLMFRGLVPSTRLMLLEK